MATTAVETWWGEYELAEGEIAALRIGPLWLYVRRTAREWNTVHRWETANGEPPLDWERVEAEALPEEGHEQARFVFSRTGGRLTLAPALADRPVITAPRVPLFLSPGEETALLVGTPLWIRVLAEGQLMRELPIHRPSDTWFGPHTMDGELCYSARTRAVLEIDNMPFLARRAVTPVRIRNRADTPLQVDRLKLPVPYLSLYASPAARLWTEAVTMERSDSTEMADLRIRPGAPDEAPKAELVGAPRESVESHSIMRVFSSLLRATGGDDD